MKISWADFKSITTNRLLSIQHFESDSSYILLAFDGNLTLECYLSKNATDTTELDDFEANFKSTSNQSIFKKDSDGDGVIRPKVTKIGWHAEPKTINWVTAKFGSLLNRCPKCTDIGDCILAFFDANDSEIIQNEGESNQDFQTRISTNCTRTAMDWTDKVDFEIIGAHAQIRQPLTSPAYLWATVAPHIAKEYGGSVPLFTGGFDLSFLNMGQFLEYDGRACKLVNYDPIYQSHRIRVLIEHAVGYQFAIQLMFELYRK